MKKIILLLVVLGISFCFTACDFGRVNVDDEKFTSGETTSKNDNENKGNDVNNTSNNESKLETNDKYANVEQNPIVTMEMANGNVVKIELYPKIAPTTVENFISLIEKGFYDGLTFHRVIPTFVAQGGDPNGNGTGGPGYTIKGEFSSNGFKNDLLHDVGVISMARTGDPNGGGSQFFIVTDDLMSHESLDGLYAGFGKVIEGMEHVSTIVNSEVIRREVDEDVMSGAYVAAIKLQNGQELTDAENDILEKYYEQASEQDRPVNPPVIKKMTVDTFGVDYDEPEKIVAGL